MRFVVSPILLMLAGAAASQSVSDGVYSKQQAARGETAYNSKCARCHGDNLMGGETSPALVDRDFLEKWNGKSVGSLVELIRKTMPSDGPGKLSRQQCTDIAAYLLSANNLPSGKGDLSSDPDTLNGIMFPAKK